MLSASFAAFWLITWQVLNNGPLLVADARLSSLVVQGVPDRITEGLSDLGNITVAVPVLATALVFAGWRGRTGGLRNWWRAPLFAGLAMAAIPALVVPLKVWTARPGPLEPWASGYYPSGHTATAAVAYVGTALLLAPYTTTRWPMAVALLLTGATAIGLVLRGFHWPLDVLASALLCIALLAPVRWAVRRDQPK
ncbi:phosphatase PAP2 family protein [Streptomyces sp. NPDC006879]|uniref:phosphatase PAP2 family protein n=1 Tax=Streptomyces sp. NPDC006879 TaxID=3364767 RepID=UPI0036C59B3A